MARRRRRSKKDPLVKAAKVVAYPWKVKSRFEGFIRPAARVAGALGMAMLAGCAALSQTPEEAWPGLLLPASRLPVYWMVALAVASLLGWAYVNDGQKRIRRAVGPALALCLFVIVPIAFAILGFAGERNVAQFGGPGPGHVLWILVRWYGPAMVVTSLAAFLTWKSRGRSGRGVWFALLVAPYAALFAYLVVGFHLPGMGEMHHETIRSLGSWALALQLALAFFVGGGD